MAGRRPSTVLWSPPAGRAPSPDFQKLGGPNPENQVALLEAFLSAGEVAAVQALARDPGVWEVDDRGAEVSYAHRVWRIEGALTRRHGDLYEKLTRTAWAVDRCLWRNLEDFAYPEIEYIEYDVEKLGKPGAFGKHTDNDSLVTMVVLLSDPADFQGGVNCFRGRPNCRVPLRTGSALFFYGDRCEHW